MNLRGTVTPYPPLPTPTNYIYTAVIKINVYKLVRFPNHNLVPKVSVSFFICNKIYISWSLSRVNFVQYKLCPERKNIPYEIGNCKVYLLLYFREMRAHSLSSGHKFRTTVICQWKTDGATCGARFHGGPSGGFRYHRYKLPPPPPNLFLDFFLRSLRCLSCIHFFKSLVPDLDLAVHLKKNFFSPNKTWTIVLCLVDCLFFLLILLAFGVWHLGHADCVGERKTSLHQNLMNF